MRAILLLVLAVAALKSSPFDDLGRLHALRGFKEDVWSHRNTPAKATFLAKKSFSEGSRRLDIVAMQYANATAIPVAIHARNMDRQGMAVDISLPELEKKGVKVHYVANPQWLESDIVVGRVWVRVSLDRGVQPKYSVGAGEKQIVDELRADSKTYRLLKDLLSEIEKRAELANAADH